MNDEPKSPAELKEIRLNRKLAQDAEGIKAMADIAAADIAIRKRTADLRAMRLAREAADRDKPAEAKDQSHLATSNNNLGIVLKDMGRTEEALAASFAARVALLKRASARLRSSLLI